MASALMTETRLAASRLLMRRLRDLKTSSRRSDRELVGSRPVVLALEDDLVREVVQRFHAYEPPVWVAVYYPQAEKLVLAEVGLAPRSTDSVLIGADTTVGMLLDAHPSLSLPDSWETIRVTQLIGA
jgi:hypothetical protein